MPVEKMLVRKNEIGEILVFLPSREAPKNFIKQWVDGAYKDVPLSAYKATSPADTQESFKAAQEYRESTGLQHARLAERLPRRYQADVDLVPIAARGAPGSYEALRNEDGTWTIRDSEGTSVAICTDEGRAREVLKFLRKQAVDSQ